VSAKKKVAPKKKALPKGWVKKTYIIQTDHVERLEWLAEAAGRKVEDVLDGILARHFFKITEGGN